MTISTPAVITSRRRKKRAAERRRFFISYRRSEPDSTALAHLLVEQLQLAGHEVFIDVAMKIGTDWVDEITKRIEWCDYLVVLLSDGARTSEMVQTEIRLAHRHFKDSGKPNILPIRMRYFGTLDAELESYVGRLQFFAWNEGGDTAAVLEALLNRAADQPVMPAASRSTAEAAPRDSRRPAPKLDSRQLVTPSPGGSMRERDTFYIARPADAFVVAAASAPTGETTVIKAARQMGKSTLLMRYLSECTARGKQTCFVDLSGFDDAEFKKYAPLLHSVACEMARAFHLPEPPASKFRRSADLTNFLTDKVLAVTSEDIVLAFDELERLLGKPYQDDFFTMLRGWHNKRAEPAAGRWISVSLAMIISTEPYLLINAADRSPFNVSPAIELTGFSRDACINLNSAYGAGLHEGQLEELFELLLGQPYLTRVAFYRLVGPDGYTFTSLMKRAAESDGPFGDHLRALLFQLNAQDGLMGGFKRLIHSGTQPNTDMYHRLHGAGLVRRDEGRVIPANLLYARFFKSVL